MSVYLDPDDDRTELVTVAEAARRVQVTVRTVNRWIARGRLPVLPGRYVVLGDVQDVERDCWKASRSGRPGARVTGVLTP